MLWILFLPLLALGSGEEITFENLNLRLIGGPVSCPDASKLQRDNNMYWSTDSGWKSYNISFSKKLTRLVAVQWQGDKVGNIFCQYKDRSQLTFPVALQAPGIYLRPEGWKAMKDGSLNCSAKNLSNCKFQAVEEVEKNYDTNQKLHNLLESIKKGKDDV